MRLTALLTSVLLAGLAACGGGSGGENGESSSNGLKRYEVAKAGFAVSAPSDWKTIDDLEGPAVEEFKQENPDFAQFLDMATQTDALQFISFDPEIKDEFATNLNVIVAPIPPSMQLEQWVQQNLEPLRGIPSAQVGEPTKADLPAGPAMRLTWSYEIQNQGAKRRVSADQYFVRKGAKAYVITFTTLPDQADTYKQTFAESARSFELISS